MNTNYQNERTQLISNCSTRRLGTWRSSKTSWMRTMVCLHVQANRIVNAIERYRLTNGLAAGKNKKNVIKKRVSPFFTKIGEKSTTMGFRQHSGKHN